MAERRLTQTNQGQTNEARLTELAGMASGLLLVKVLMEA